MLKYIIFGIIQGLTEPIPVSSSGHLMLFRNLFNTEMFNDLNFEIFANFGSFIAIFLIFRKDIIKLIKNFFKYIFNKKIKKNKEVKADFKYCLLIIIGTIPVGISGFLLKDIIESKLDNLPMLGIAFLITAICLFVVSKYKGHKEDQDITYIDAILIGLMQSFAILPGISRSGTTLVGCLLRGMKRETALKYSFMLYLPVSVATMGLSLYELINEGTLGNLLAPYMIGLIVAGIGTYFATKWLFKEVKNGKLWRFAVYCLILSLFVLFIL